MSTFIRILGLVTLAAVMFGCASDNRNESGKHSDQLTGTKHYVMQSGGRDVLWLTVPADADCTAKDGSLDMKWHDSYVEIWLVRGAKTVDEGVGRVAHEITDEFKDFKTTSTTNLTIAGVPAKRLLGSGAEADDGDPGQADLIVFKAGPHIFVACTHGESLASEAQEWMRTVVQTAQAP